MPELIPPNNFFQHVSVLWTMVRDKNFSCCFDLTLPAANVRLQPPLMWHGIEPHESTISVEIIAKSNPPKNFWYNVIDYSN